jgi:hypothetical protein
VSINGPLEGWGIENIAIDCNTVNNASIGLLITSGRYGYVRDVTVKNALDWGVKSTAFAPSGLSNNTDSLHNRYEGLTVSVPSGGLGGILLTGVTTANTDFNVFTSTTVALLGTTSNGIYLQGAAGNLFLDAHVTGAAGNTSVVFDYTLNNTWPANNVFDMIEPAVGATFMSNAGSPGAGAKPNYLRNLITTDGATYPTLANLVTDGGQAFGTQTNDAANAGNVGEFISSTVVQGSAVALTNNTPANVTSISLTAGDWDVWFIGYFNPAGTTNITLLSTSISTTSATMDNNPGNLGIYSTGAQVPGNPIGVTAGPRRVSIAATTTVFAVANALFTVSTLGGYGILRARRVR